MITSEEHEAIVADAIEGMLKKLPEIVSNIMVSNAAYAELSVKFFDDNPDFVNHKEIVRSVVQMTESDNPTKNYDEIFKLAIPEIKRQIAIKGKVSMEPVVKESLDLSCDFPTTGDNGAL